MFHSMTDVPHFVEKELEKLEEMMEPLTKKASKYSFWSMPLIVISFFHLFILLFVIPNGQMIEAIIYALIGAVGWAFHKEAKFQHKELWKKSSEYMMERIKSSNVASHSLKQKYTTLVQEQSAKSVLYFVEFLKEEHNQRISNF